ncbi:MAG: hypothetical protein C4516_01700 [Oxalobacter sp.]|nr:MAG: hypothetical protein C4516_01700 [Oxalobacter sp.]
MTKKFRSTSRFKCLSERKEEAMTARKEQFKNTYTCKVSGEGYEYEAEYAIGKKVKWSARIYKDGELKGNPTGEVANELKGEALKQYIIAYIEGIIEKHLGVAE